MAKKYAVEIDLQPAYGGVQVRASSSVQWDGFWEKLFDPYKNPLPISTEATGELAAKVQELVYRHVERMHEIDRRYEIEYHKLKALTAGDQSALAEMQQVGGEIVRRALEAGALRDLVETGLVDPQTARALDAAGRLKAAGSPSASLVEKAIEASVGERQRQRRIAELQSISASESESEEEE